MTSSKAFTALCINSQSQIYRGAGDAPDPGTSYAPFKLYNIGNNNPVELTEFIAAIEETLGKQAQKEYLDLQPGDVPATYADVDDLINDVGFKPSTPLKVGIARFIEWYENYYSYKIVKRFY